jgi:hypothetical protein
MEMKLSAICLLCVAGLPVLAQSKSVCAMSKESILINIPGYEREPGAVQPKTIAAFQRCVKRYPICLLLNDGKIVAGAAEAQVRVMQELIVFASVQHLRTQSHSYCAFASLQADVGGSASWTYRTFTPNGGWIGEDLADPSTGPKTSGQVFSMLSKNFKLFQKKMRELLAAERGEDYGYRVGEQP